MYTFKIILCPRKFIKINYIFQSLYTNLRYFATFHYAISRLSLASDFENLIHQFLHSRNIIPWSKIYKLNLPIMSNNEAFLNCIFFSDFSTSKRINSAIRCRLCSMFIQYEHYTAATQKKKIENLWLHNILLEMK